MKSLLVIVAFTLLIAAPVQAQISPYVPAPMPMRPLDGQMRPAPNNMQPFGPQTTPPTTWSGQTLGNTDYWRSNNGQSFSCRRLGPFTNCD